MTFCVLEPVNAYDKDGALASLCGRARRRGISSACTLCHVGVGGGGHPRLTQRGCAAANGPWRAQHGAPLGCITDIEIMSYRFWWGDRIQEFGDSTP